MLSRKTCLRSDAWSARRPLPKCLSRKPGGELYFCSVVLLSSGVSILFPREHDVKSHKNQEPLYLGADLGGSNLRLALVRGDGEIVARVRCPTTAGRSVEGVLDAVLAMASQLRGHASCAGGEVKALGVGVPGLVSPEPGEVVTSPNFPDWRNVPLRNLLERALCLPVHVENDVNAIVVGEWMFGAAQGARDVLAVTLGTGVGGGLILGGELRRGPDGTAAEVGHVAAMPQGRACRCGSRGCLEAYASATALTARATELGLLEPSVASAEGLAALARGGDRRARRVFAEAGRYLGIVLAGAANLLNLEVVVVGGGVSRSWDLLQPSTQREIVRRAFQAPAKRLRIVATKLYDDAGTLGAVWLARHAARGTTPRGGPCLG